MAMFIKIPPLRIGRRGQWVLTDELVCFSEVAVEAGYYDGVITVPAEFETDLASIPRIITPIIPKDGNHRAPAIVHDHLCREKVIERAKADKVFLELMAISDVPKWRRWSMWAAVRLVTFLKGNPKGTLA